MKKGFTLIEVIVVLAIISILLIPAFSTAGVMNKFVAGTAFDTTANQLLKDLRYAKLLAVDHGSVKIYFRDNGYIIYDYTDLNNMVVKDVTYRDGIIFNRDKSTTPLNRTIKFTEDGGISPYPCSISIKDNLGNVSIITIKVGSLTIDFKK